MSALVRHKMASASSSRVVEETASYWDWPTTAVPPVDMCAASHVQANLVQEAAQGTSRPSHLVAAHDEYWAEGVDTPLHQVVEDASAVAASYWDERLHSTTTADEYWKESTSRHYHRACAADYWNEPSHERSALDQYWQESSSSATPARLSYWQEASHAPTTSDQYWSMVAR